MKRSLLAIGFSIIWLVCSGIPAYGGGGHGGGHGGGGWGGGGGHGGGWGGNYGGRSGGWSGGGSYGRAGSYSRGGSWGGGGHSFISGRSAGFRGSAAGVGRYSVTHRGETRSYSGAPQGGVRTNRSTGVDQQRGPGVNRSHHIDNNRLGNRNTTSARDRTRNDRNWSRHDSINRKRFGRQTQDRLRNWHGNKSNFAEAKQRHHDHHNRHDHDWWKHNCSVIVLVGGGYWGWWDGWWYPAWGYDPYYSYYEYDGPIYSYDGLAPDEIVANVQTELQRLGYYNDAIDGIFGPSTQDALWRYQRDRQLPITRAIDPDTIEALGLT